jgi:hypothetical protein
MVLGGFQEFHKQTRLYSSKEFDQKDVYFNLFESKGLSALYIREMDLTHQLFIDPITKGILEQMGQPQTYHGLILKAVEMLDTYHHPDGQDMRYQRIRGYERFPGTIYKAMVTSIRQFKNKNISGKSRVEMSPYEVWSTIVKDPAVKMVEDINPIQNLKGSEIVTYVGEGGRAKEAMNKASRAYHVADMGIISEATVDSRDAEMIRERKETIANMKDPVASPDNASMTPSSAPTATAKTSTIEARNASTAEAKAEIKAKTGETPNIAPPVASAVKSQEQSK